MKLLYALLALAFLAAPGMAMNVTDEAYLKGFQAGYNMRALWQDDVAAYNAEVAKFNSSLVANLNESEASAFMLPFAAERIAPVPNIFNARIPVEELKR